MSYGRRYYGDKTKAPFKKLYMPYCEIEPTGESPYSQIWSHIIIDLGMGLEFFHMINGYTHLKTANGLLFSVRAFEKYVHEQDAKYRQHEMVWKKEEIERIKHLEDSENVIEFTRPPGE